VRSVRPLPPLRTWLAALVLTLATLLAVPLAAGAQSTTANGLSARTAAALERSPVVVSAPYDAVITPAAERRLVRKIKALDQPILMALVPLVEGDQFNGDARAFVSTLRDRMNRDGIYVAVDNRYLRAFEYRAGETFYRGSAEDAMQLANYANPDGSRATDAYDRTLLERAERFLDNLALPAAELEKRTAAFESQRDQQISRGNDPRDGGSALATVLVGGAILLIAGFLVHRARRRSGARPASSALPVLPDRVFEHARAAQRANLREDADDELMKLSKVLDDQPMPKKPAAQDAYQRALDAYAAARRRTGTEAPTVDLVGALVLVDHARHDLATAAAVDAGKKPRKRPALCVFDPLHGRADRNVRWQHDGRRLQVPACTACATAVERGADPDALRDGDRPYFEADSVWARTGFGAFSDDLVERVARGER